MNSVKFKDYNQFKNMKLHRLGGGMFSQVYHFMDDYAIKIYNGDADEVLATIKGNADQAKLEWLTTLRTKNGCIKTPISSVTFDGKLKGYIMKEFAGKDYAYINSMTELKSMLLGMKKLYEDIEEISLKYNCRLRDIHTKNILFSNDFNIALIDTDCYEKSKVKPEITLKQNIEEINRVLAECLILRINKFIVLNDLTYYSELYLVLESGLHGYITAMDMINTSLNIIEKEINKKPTNLKELTESVNSILVLK